MFSKHVSQLTYDDIEDLVSVRKEREGYHLDFKGEFGNPDKAKKELSKDFTAFANSGGGFLVIGVDKNYNIIGVDKKVNNKDIDEWINQIISTNIEPPIFYFDPKTIEIPNSDKIIVVIYIPESTKKPHITTEHNNYFIRLNDSSKPANHNQIRDMFEFSKNRTDEFNAFLKKRNLEDEDDASFGLNRNSKSLFSTVVNETNFPKPLVLFSLIPKFPKEEKINLSVSELRDWLKRNATGYYPDPSKSLYQSSYFYDLKLDGILLKNILVYEREINSYFEILNNGFVEAGLSNSIIYPYKNKQTNNDEVAIHLTDIITYEMLLLGFSKKFYELIKYYDDVLLQISFVNMLNLKPYGFHYNYDNFRTRELDSLYNKQHNNFKLNFRFNPKTLTENDILTIAKNHSEKIGRVFGLEYDRCFVDDKLSPVRGSLI
ncbi:AlbA family DNA-binding domain-containing protein [Hugenholtzia roseola]|uniref:AlbA family DNA-binding domain-containing protein n=1 Tax=Hugenholtzia roseola TaxID=1002 RepID=UPI00047C5B70|nr:ATP-binding protein [Hugenholtzia roseola]